MIFARTINGQGLSARTLASRAIFGMAFIAGAAVVSAAAPDDMDDPAAQEHRYGRCVEMAEKAPDRGINLALEWQSQGGGVPARHCEALGLFYGKEFGEAAIRLESLAEDMRLGRDMPIRDGKAFAAGPTMIADTWSQAANAWLLQGETVRAEAAIDRAIAICASDDPLYATLILDRARIAAADGDYGLALEDLKQVQLLDSGRKDILILIASAARELGAYADALVVLDDYQAIFPDDPVGYLERGNLLEAMGDIAGARAAWLKVLNLAPDGPDGEAARANIQRLDVTLNDPDVAAAG